MKYVLTHTLTRINLENVMVSERNQSQRPHIIQNGHIIQNAQTRQTNRERKQIHGCQGLGYGKMESNCYWVSGLFAGGDDNVLKLEVIIAYLCIY